MPSVINLGQFGSPRENEVGRGIRLAGQAIQQGKIRSAELGFKQKELESTERRHKESLATQEKIAETSALVSGARTRATKENNEKTLALKVYDKVMLGLAGMSEQEQNDKLSSESMLSLSKDLIGKNIPELVGSDGRLLKNVPEKPYTPNSREEKIQFEKDLAAGVQAIKDGKPLNARDIASVTNALKIMVFSGVMDHSVAKEMQAQLAPRMEELLRSPNAGLEPNDTDLQNPFTQGLSSPGDPLGIR
jgi:hypothetical protein